MFSAWRVPYSNTSRRLQSNSGLSRRSLYKQRCAVSLGGATEATLSRESAEIIVHQVLEVFKRYAKTVSWGAAASIDGIIPITYNCTKRNLQCNDCEALYHSSCMHMLPSLSLYAFADQHTSLTRKATRTTPRKNSVYLLGRIGYFTGQGLDSKVSCA